MGEATITINMDALTALSAELGLVPAAIDRALATVLNRRAPDVMEDAKSKITSRVRLSESYVADRMRVTKATLSRPVAVVIASERSTKLASYMAVQRISGAPGAKGDQLRRIPAGFKQAGIYTGVKTGNRKLLSRAFMIPLQMGVDSGGNGMGVFVREGKGRKAIRHLYGPSVNQLFSGVVVEIEEPLKQMLEDDLMKEVADEMRAVVGALK